MSSLIVEVCEVSKVEKHPNADKLQICCIKGWEVITAVGDIKPMDKVIYVPPDCVLNQELAEKWGVAPYLKQLPKDQLGNRPTGGRVGVTKLRGIHSFGFIAPLEDQNLPVGTNVAEQYGITKWEPPVKSHEGDAASDCVLLHGYTDIENIRNFPDVFIEGEPVIFSEKLHGQSCRVGLIRSPADDGSQTFVWMAGSHHVRRKEFDNNGNKCKFWEPLTENVKSLLTELSANEHTVVLFCEIIGSGIQDMTYGMSNGKRTFRAFDISVDGTYLDFDDKNRLFTEYKIDSVPILYSGPFSKEKMMEFTTGRTAMCELNQSGKFCGKEGIVITPTKERWVAKPGRVILKSINPDYLTRKDGTEYH